MLLFDIVNSSPVCQAVQSANRFARKKRIQFSSFKKWANTANKAISKYFGESIFVAEIEDATVLVNDKIVKAADTCFITILSNSQNGDEKNFIFIDLQTASNPNHLKWTIAHELGHIKCGHNDLKDFDIEAEIQADKWAMENLGLTPMQAQKILLERFYVLGGELSEMRFKRLWAFYEY